jgi:hypothetical protein
VSVLAGGGYSEQRSDFKQLCADRRATIESEDFCFPEVPIESENPKIQRHHKPRVPKYHTYCHPKGTIGPGNPSISALATKLHRPDTLPPAVSSPTRVPRISVVHLINLASKILMHTPDTVETQGPKCLCVIKMCLVRLCICVSVFHRPMCVVYIATPYTHSPTHIHPLTHPYTPCA